MNMKYGKELESGNRAYEAPDVGLSGVDALVSDARCPLCGDRVFIPNKAIRDANGGDNDY